MCGIFGAVGPLSQDAVTRALESLRHRGPEANGAVTVGMATLAHTRLRIIDLSPSGAQPMSNEDGKVWVTFNGEIYNFADLRQELQGRGHRFRSRADTEVIVHGYEEWGDAVVDKLDGMFAFGVWDDRRGRLLLARDRCGKKPLFFTQQGDTFLFASEIKALFAAGVRAEVDVLGVAGVLAYGYAPPPGTVYRGVSQLEPAHLLVHVPSRQTAARRYWQVSFAARPFSLSEDDAAARVRELVIAAVRRRLVADVPVGAFLSGGLDSTIIVGVMAELGHQVRTFSIGFAGDPRYDERGYARRAADAFRTNHTEFVVEASDFSLVDDLVWYHDGPFGDSSAIPTYVVSRLTREHVTVALTGDGGDELFAGYLRLWAGAAAERIPALLRRYAARVADRLPRDGHSRSRLAFARRFLSGVARPLGDRLAGWSSLFALDLEQTLQPEVAAAAPAERILAFHRGFFHHSQRATPLSQALQHNFGAYLPYDLLVKTDRSSMAHALEARSPFLDTALIEFVAPLPDSLKVRRGKTKYLLRRAFAPMIPREIMRRRKQGFGVPLGAWFRSDLAPYLRERLDSPSSRIRDYVRPEVIRRLLAEHASRAESHEHRIWLLVTMESWLRNFDRLAHGRRDAAEPVPPMAVA